MVVVIEQYISAKR